MSIQRAITKAVMSVMCLSLPTLLRTAQDAVSTVAPMTPIASSGRATNIGDIAVNMQSSMQSMTDIMGMFLYIMGIMFGLMAVLEFKAYNESFNNEEEDTDKKVNLEKSVSLIKKDDTIKAAVDKIEQVKDIFKKEKLYDYDFEDKELSELGVQIQNKVKYLKGHSFLQKDMESLLMVENTEKEYLEAIHKKYIEVLYYRRGNKSMENSPYNLTFRQLNLILKGLDEIEEKIVKNNIMDQKANEIFLKQKIASM